MSGSEILLDVDGHQVSGLSAVAPANGSPLLVALHGGGYNACYFDVPGSSFLGRCAAEGYSAFALDRPGYGASTPFSYDELTYAANAAVLAGAIGEIWDRYGEGRMGVVLVGHSMGGAIACHIATRSNAWPILGVSMTGIAHEPPPGADAVLNDVPEGQPVSFPPEAIVGVMYGPDWSYAPEIPAAAAAAVADMPRPELVEVYGCWIEQAKDVASRITVPVQYGLAEYDHFWTPGRGTVDAFGALFTASPYVEADVLRSTGHNVEHHLLALAWLRRVLAFADLCTIERLRSAP